SGVDYTHPDLAPNMWINSREIPDNGIDDDGNGIVDDIHGADFLSDKRNHNGNPTDHNGHGTHCAGIIAAVADNDLGGVGVAYNSRIMAIKAAQYNGSLTSSDIAESVYYAVENGADVINMSFGGSALSTLVRDALGIAFGQAVLVAAAGNDGKHNEAPPINPLPMYPASWPFVIGVMAENTVPSLKGEWLAGFSNWDSKPSSRIEYEMMAPGVQIYSTLPGGKYAAWNGTSMAAPVAAGVAALVRTKYSDKNSYSSRFIMGQVASTGASKMGKAPPGMSPISYASLDGESALSKVPKPELVVVDYQIFDDPSFSEVNDGDGIVDSGETIELAVTIKNRWGKADPVTVTLAAQAGGAGILDPFVTWGIDTVDYGAVGNFGEDDNGVIRDPEGLVTGVENPFRFVVSKDAFNNHIIPIKVSISAGNGFDAEDSNAPYEFEGSFDLIVQRGRVLPSVIEEDLVMTKDDYWIVEQPVYIPEGVTVTVTEGTQVQFWNSKSTFENPPYIAVEGILTTSGLNLNPVEFFPDVLGNVNTPDTRRKLVNILEFEKGKVDLEYFRIIDPFVYRGEYLGSDGRPLGISSARHGFVTQAHTIASPRFFADECHKVHFYKIGFTERAYYAPGNLGFYEFPTDRTMRIRNTDTCLIDNSRLSLSRAHGPCQIYRKTVLVNAIETYQNSVNPTTFTASKDHDCEEDVIWSKNAVLLNTWDDRPNYNPRFFALNDGADLSSTFWGTTSLEIIERAIVDSTDNFNRADYIVEPMLTEAPESCWPFVVDCILSTELES
ncbi:S8 family serine peptidase, partial [Akkermansiaceae bacterium]|nr:S8 family serine peptidase [Akkermansiaceae bacterium]